MNLLALLEMIYVLVVEPATRRATRIRRPIAGASASWTLNIHIAENVFAGVLSKAGELVHSANQDHRKGGFVIWPTAADSSSSTVC